MNAKFDAWKTPLVTLLCLSGATTASWLLYVDLNAVDWSGSGEQLGRIERKSAFVRRKSASSYLWGRAENGQSLYRRDSVQVGPESSAAISLKDGTTLELGENSVVVIDDLKNFAMSFLRGSFVLRTKDGDHQVVVDKSGKVRQKQLSARLLLPAAHVNRVTGESQTGTRFQWSHADNAPELRLEVSQDRQFSPAATRQLPVSGQKETSVPLPAGKYYWRLSSGALPITETREFTLEQVTPLRPLFPASAGHVQQWGDSGSVQFRWAGSERIAGTESEKHFVEVARDPLFKELVRTEPVNRASGGIALNQLPAGNLYWRLRSEYDDTSVTSPPQAFIVVKTAEVKVEAEHPEADMAAPLPKTVRLQWAFAAPDAEYQVEIARAEGQGFVPVVSTNVRSRAFSWHQPTSGRHRWRVTARTVDGQKMGDTGWREFSFFSGKPIATKFPPASAPVHYWEKPTTIPFQWEGSAEDRYELELAEDFGFKSILSRETVQGSQLAFEPKSMKPGTYFWRVRKIDADGRPQQSSELQSFVLGQHPPLPAPTTASPGSNAFIDREKQSEPKLSWAAVPDAVEYELTITEGKEIRKKVVRETSFALSVLSEGKYSWSVRPIDRLKRLGEALPPREFSVSPLPPPKDMVSEVK